MVRFINGGVNSDREKQMLDLICDSVSNGRRTVVIIPDQYSFEYDKKLYNRLGAVKFNKLTTVGFNRLAELLEKQYGSPNNSGNADDNSKFIIMYKAVKELRHKKLLGFYTSLADKSGVEKGNFISQLIEIIGQLRESGISSEMLKSVSMSLNSTLAQKMNDIAAIYSEYMSQLEKAGLHDSVSGLAAAVKIARENRHFCGKDVYVDAFSSFTYDEMQMLELCISEAENVTFSFVIDSDSVKNSIHPFRLPEQTFGLLKNAANNKGYTVVETHEVPVQSRDIVHLGKNILSINKRAFDGDPENVRVLSADDIYSEASYVCAAISHLVADGSSYSDIAVIVRNIEECSAVFEGMMERYDIPFFIDRQDHVSASSIVQYFNIIFRCLSSREHKTENILKMIKSPFFSPKKYLVNEIEQYCFKWGIDGEMWSKEYFGLDKSLIDDDEQKLVENDGKKTGYIELIESIRKDIIQPLDKMRKLCGKGEVPASVICKAFFDLLNEYKVSDRTYSVVRTATLNDNETQIELSRGLRQLWNSVLSAVKTIYDCLKDEPISLRQFYELYRVMLSQLSVSAPPQKLDCVRIVDASHSRLSCVKTAFLCQVNDGVFPKSFSNNGLLSHIDISCLQTALGGLEKDLVRSFSGDARNAFMREDLACYNAVSLPTQKLFVTYVTADLSGEDKRPSSLVKEILGCFKDFKAEKISDIPVQYFCTSYKSAYHTAVEHFRYNTSEVESVKMSLNDTEYAGRLSSMYKGEKQLDEKKTDADSELSSEAFFKNGKMQISASQIDMFFKCPFSYFCRYGLKLRAPRKMELNSIQKGLIIHSVLEYVFSQKNSGGELCVLDPENSESFIESAVDKCFDDYLNDVLKSSFAKSAVFFFELDRLKLTAVTIVRFVRDELAASGFRPVAAEYGFGSKGQNEPIEFSLKSGNIISLSGVIDRVDISTDDEKGKYVRIIDYKTGTIDIDYALLQCGLDLQMLVYLDAYLRSVKDNPELEPAAIEYFPFKGNIKFPLDKNTLESDHDSIIQNSILDLYRPKGYIANIPDVVGSIPFSEKKSTRSKEEKSKKISVDELRALRQYACEKVIEFAGTVELGDFPMKPVNNTCKYCDYASICCKDKCEDRIDLNKVGNELAQQLKSELEQIISENSGKEDK